MPLVEVNNTRLYYEIHGDGSPFLIINGLGGNHLEWMPHQVPVWSREYRVILYDHRGTGRSDKPDEAYTTRSLAADAVGLLDALHIREPAHVLGPSHGGRTAQWVALDYPERVRSLVLAATGPGQIDPAFEPTRGIPAHVVEAMVEKGYERYMREHLGGDFFFSAEFRQKQPQAVQEHVELYFRYPTPLRNYLRHVIARQTHQTLDLLPNIQAPTLVIVGEHDTAAVATGNHVATSRLMAERISNAELVLVKDAAHSFFQEAPEQANAAILNFLRRH
ncbi:MAG: alpha/beta hydrolase [Anaerolineae bacterium]